MSTAVLEPERVTADPSKKTARIALVGFARSYSDAPFHDPDVTIVGMNELYKIIPRWDVWFELHDTAYLGKTARVETPDEPERHLAWLKAQRPEKPIYMLQQFADIPASVAYPLEAMVARFGRYFTSTVGYMLAWAIATIVDGRQDPAVHEPGEWIGLYGIDLASDTEYVHQRPNAEYLIGWARGLGIEVYVPETAAVTHSPSLYGFEPPPMEAGLISEWYLRSQADKMREKSNQAQASLNTLDGVIQAYGHLYTSRDRPELDTREKLLEFCRQQFDEKTKAHAQALADWNSINGALQAFMLMRQVMEFKRRGVYVPETDPFAPSATSERAC